MDANRRRRSRVDMHIAATFTPKGGTPVQLLVCNISLKGLLAVPEANVKTGGAGMVRIALSKDAVIQIECRVIRSDATGVAIDFKPMDEQSFFHLRNLVRYNAPDADQIDAELKHPAFDD
jgi:c-di-GMP-binding flagellar brake protein YcgR